VPVYVFNEEVFHETHRPAKRIVDVKVKVKLSILLLRVECIALVSSTPENSALSGSEETTKDLAKLIEVVSAKYVLQGD